ncbi:hypothetical protein NL676_038653 [Syzygium grande]|nr:hypothetical protein NL676_038653 [Syzygium grande]
METYGRNFAHSEAGHQSPSRAAPASGAGTRDVIPVLAPSHAHPLGTKAKELSNMLQRPLLILCALQWFPGQVSHFQWLIQDVFTQEHHVLCHWSPATEIQGHDCHLSE